MLFYVGWKPRAGQGPEQAEAGLNVFVRWKAPMRAWKGVRRNPARRRAVPGLMLMSGRIAGSRTVVGSTRRPWRPDVSGRRRLPGNSDGDDWAIVCSLP
jgi:hypothetical protein